MSVAAFIVDAQNDLEKRFYIPIATEDFFYKHWMPGIQALKLERLQYITPGIDLQEIDLPNILDEIKQLITWVDQNIKDEAVKEHIFTRAKLLEMKLPNAFQRKDAVVFIG